MPSVSRLVRLFRDADRIARRHGISGYSVLRRVARLWVVNGIRPRESLASGLADPSVPEENLAGCLGKERLERLQKELNPPGLECLLKDKTVFYPYCMGLGIRVPRLYAVFDVLGGWSPDGSPLVHDQAWETFLRERLPEEFVIKPAWGLYGEGFHVFRRDGDRFVDSSGRGRAALEVVGAMRGHPVYRRWVLQERLRSHPDLERLSGTSYLQTVRVMTFAFDDGTARAFAPHLKVIGGEAVIDNIQGGRGGNFPAAIAPADGVLWPGRVFDRDGAGMTTLLTHPRTGVRLEGFRLPFWAEARTLVEQAARGFLPIRTIGWDVALTPDGPVIVEGNIWWDPPNDLASAPAYAEGGMRQLLEVLRAEARRPSRPGRGYRADRR